MMGDATNRIGRLQTAPTVNVRPIRLLLAPMSWRSQNRNVSMAPKHDPVIISEGKKCQRTEATHWIFNKVYVN